MENIEQKLREELVPILGLDSVDEVQPDMALVADIGAESIDFVEIMYMIENTFGVKIKISELPRGEDVAETAEAGEQRLAAERAGVTGEYVLLMQHMIISHHGDAEFGSPKPPMFPEAEALHWIDIMDARMNTMKTAMDKTPEGAFSEKIYSLERRVYHPRYTDDAE